VVVASFFSSLASSASSGDEGGCVIARRCALS
jgi:hypothetical protein